MKGGTAFLVNMINAPDAKLAKADADKLAAKYGVKPEWVKMCLHFWRHRGN